MTSCDHSHRGCHHRPAAFDPTRSAEAERRLFEGPVFGRRPLGRAALRAVASLIVAAGPCAHALAAAGEKPSHRFLQATPHPSGGGCWLSEDEAEVVLGSPENQASAWIITEDGTTIVPSSGDTRLDAAFGDMLADLASKFDVRPGFGFFDDSGAPNAFATSISYMPNTQGTVAMGQTLMREFLTVSAFGDVLLMGVTAHEFGHIKQFFHPRGVYERLRAMHSTVKFIELHADFMAGYYIGMRASGYSQEQLVTLGRGFESMGDTAYTNENHHGTHAERIAAIENGYRMAVLTHPGVEDAINAGLFYLRA